MIVTNQEVVATSRVTINTVKLRTECKCIKYPMVCNWQKQQCVHMFGHMNGDHSQTKISSVKLLVPSFVYVNQKYNGFLAIQNCNLILKLLYM